MSGGTGRTVVVVDDNAVSLAYAEEVLRGAGFSVISVNSPFAVSSALTSHRPDLVLIDVSMPALTGDKVVEVIRRHSLHQCALVLYSERSEAELERLADQCGATGYIAKGGDAQAFCDKVASFCS